MIRRLLAALAVVVSLVVLPWEFSMLLAILFSLSFGFYLEVIFLGLILDILYGAGVPRLFHFTHFFLVISIIIFAAASYAREQMMFYRSSY